MSQWCRCVACWHLATFDDFYSIADAPNIKLLTENGVLFPLFVSIQVYKVHNRINIHILYTRSSFIRCINLFEALVGKLRVFLHKFELSKWILFQQVVFLQAESFMNLSIQNLSIYIFLRCVQHISDLDYRILVKMLLLIILMISWQLRFIQAVWNIVLSRVNKSFMIAVSICLLFSGGSWERIHSNTATVSTRIR